MVIYDGTVLAAWGNIERRYMCHSIRKSYLSALYGIHVGKGNINLNVTLAALNIDDEPPLTKAEKNARVFDLLTSRSGVYHDAANESEEMSKYRPKRGSHPPGEFFWYNNWGFAALGTIFEQETNTRIFVEFKKQIADPLDMQDFRLELTNYQYEPDRSIHPGYPFRMSTRDMARFGLLYLREGIWNNKQIIPKNWTKESTSPHVVFDKPYFSYTGYGYMWWAGELGDSEKYKMYSASGYGGHSIDVLPAQNLVFVHRVDTYAQKNVDKAERLKLLNMVLAAKVSEAKPHPKMMPIQDSLKRTDIVELAPNILDRYVKTYKVGNFEVIITKSTNNGLLIESRMKYKTGKFRLLPLSKTRFVAEDVEAPVSFGVDDSGNPVQITIEFPSGEKLYGSPID